MGCADCASEKVDTGRGGPYILPISDAVSLATGRRQVTTINIISAAVAPLRAEAIARAEVAVVRWVQRTTEEIAAARGDLEQVAPLPHGRMSSEEYRATRSRRAAVLGIARRVAPHQPKSPVVVDPTLVDRLIERTRDEAAASFNGYVTKLAGKVGAIRSASICGAALWHGSTLTVETEANEAQRWRTTQIVNVSSLGKAFNQWPTRRVK